MKAITPVIATVMLMLITVGMVGMTYIWFFNMMTTQTEKNIAIPIGGVQCYNNRISAIVTNAGANSNITDDDIVIADINGVSVRNTLFFGGFNTNGLVGYWRFEGDAKDLSGYGNDGTVTGATQTDGKFGKAYSFATGNYISVPYHSSLDITSAITVEGWLSVPTAPSGDSKEIVSAKAGAYELFYDHNPWGGATFVVYKPALDNTPTYTGITATYWHHIAGVYDGANLYFYVDGVEIRKKPSTGTITINGNKLGIGAYGDGTTANFNGLIDEVAIWNRALTPSEVTQLNKTNAGNFTLAPNRAITLINRYPVFAKGKYTVRVGTRNGVIERTVECL